MERMGRMKKKALYTKMGWNPLKFYRRMQQNKFSDEELELIATSMNALQPYLQKTSVEALTGDVELPDTLVINGITYIKKKE